VPKNVGNFLFVFIMLERIDFPLMDCSNASIFCVPNITALFQNPFPKELFCIWISFYDITGTKVE
jgi:hypothetical protein